MDLTEVTTTYQYDAFGRRISKHTQTKHKSKQANQFNSSGKVIAFPIQKHKTKHHHVAYLWDGNRQLQEYTDTHIFTTIYEQNSFEPVARLVWLKDELLKSANDEILNAEREPWQDDPKLIPNIQVYHYHNDHLGTPNELTNDEGDVVWLADYEAWGNTAKVVYKEVQLHNTVISDNELQPIRFQGQFIDQETGLHYNRFRYFDPDLGMFTTRDPIGLMGGMNTFQYAPNPTGWVDPFGLSGVKLTEGTIYRMGSGTDNNLTPRPGKDTSSGLSTSLDAPKEGKFQSIDVSKLDEAGLEAINDHGNHVSIRPKDDPDFEKLKEWADTRGTNTPSKYTQGMQDAKKQC